MKIRDFGLEIFFGRYEFSAPYLLAQSDCESLSIRELLALEPGAQEGFLDTWLGYSENDGAPALREAVSGLYTQCGRKTCCCMWARRRPSSGRSTCWWSRASM